MAPMKRPAAAASAAGAKKAAPAKRARTVDPDLATYQLIIDAVKGAEGFPQSVLNGLAGMVTVALSTRKDVRHRFSENALSMVEEVLKSIETAARDQVQALEAKVSESDSIKASREADAAASQTRETERAGEVEAAKAKLASANEESAKAKAVLQDAERELKKTADEVAAAADSQSKLEAAKAGEYAAVKESPSAAGTKAFLKAVRGLGFDANMLKAAESSLAKTTEERGTFDNLVVGQIDGAFEELLKSASEKVANGETVRAERQAAVTAAQTDADARGEEEKAAKAALGEATANLATAVEQRKAAVRSVKELGPEMKRAGSDLVAAKKELERALGIVSHFERLRDLATEVEPAAAESAAEGGEEHDKAKAQEEPAAADVEA